MPSSGASRPVSAVSTRQFRYSSRVIHSRHLNFLVSQPAMPTWSGCMCVQKMRLSFLPSVALANSWRQAASVSSVRMPVSTMAQPSPSWMPQMLMWFSIIGSGMRIHTTPGATSSAAPGSGGCSKG